MKTALSIILLFASLGNLIAQDPGATDITVITPTTSTTFGSTEFTITVGVSPAAIAVGDIVILSKAAADTGVVDADPRFPITTAIAAAGTGMITIEIKSSGTYFVYLRRGTTTVKQTTAVVQVVVTIDAPGADLVSSIDKTTAVKATDTTIVFTLKTTTSLPKYYRLVFSKEAVPVSTDPAYELTTASAATTLSATFKFPADGTYSLFVVNEIATKQGALTVAVTVASSYLTVSLGVLICMLLF